MKVSFLFKDEEGRRTLHFLRLFFKRPKAGLDALAKLAALEVAAQQARLELADAERSATTQALEVGAAEPAPAGDNPAKRAAEIMFDALNQISRGEAFFDDAKRLKRIATTAVLQVEKLVRETKQK
jgi:hypothetical protein